MVTKVAPLPPSPPGSENVWPPQGQWTYDDFLRLPDDGRRYEIIEGVLYVTNAPSYEHQFAVTEIVRQLARLNVRAVIDEFSNRNLRSEFGQSSEVIAMPMGDDQMIDLLKSRILDGRRDTACIARSRCARPNQPSAGPNSPRSAKLKPIQKAARAAHSISPASRWRWCARS